MWSVADLLRGDYEQSEYGRVILPLETAVLKTVTAFANGSRASAALPIFEVGVRGTGWGGVCGTRRGCGGASLAQVSRS